MYPAYALFVTSLVLHITMLLVLRFRIASEDYGDIRKDVRYIRKASRTFLHRTLLVSIDICSKHVIISKCIFIFRLKYNAKAQTCMGVLVNVRNCFLQEQHLSRLIGASELFLSDKHSLLPETRGSVAISPALHFRT